MSTRGCADCGRVTRHGTRCPQCEGRRYEVEGRRRNPALRRQFLAQWVEERGPWCALGTHFVAEREMTVDHIVPTIAGGEEAWSNFQGACRSCNSRKKDA